MVVDSKGLLFHHPDLIRRMKRTERTFSLQESPVPSGRETAPGTPERKHLCPGVPSGTAKTWTGQECPGESWIKGKSNGEEGKQGNEWELQVLCEL